MNRISRFLTGSVLFCAMSGAALAAPITYDFRNNAACGNFNAVTETCEVDGLSMTVTSTGGRMNNNRNGIGINNGAARNSIGEFEALLFDFNPQSVLAVSSIVLEKRSRGRDSGAGSFDLYLNGGFWETISWSAGGGNAQITEPFANAGLVSTIGFQNVTGAFRLSTLDVSIPEPAALAVMSIGLIGLGLARRRSKV